MAELRLGSAARPALVLAAMLPLWGCSGEGPTGTGALPDAIRAARDSGSLQDGESANAVVSRFIPIGAELAPALALLTDAGFIVAPMTSGRPSRYTGDAAFIASQKGRSQDLCDEEWRVLIDSRAGRVVQVDSFLFKHCV